MPVDLPHPVDALRELAVNRAQCAMHAVGIRGHGDEMHMVRHQAVREDLEPMPPGMRVQEAQVRLWIALFEENVLAVIPPLRHMMGDARKHDSAPPWHRYTVMGLRARR